MTNFTPKRAKRQKLRLAMQLIGPSGSGKTLGGLILAYGMMKEKYPEMDEFDLWGKIGLVDTEHERALIYEGMQFGTTTVGQFFHMDLQKPYSFESYKRSVDGLVKEGVEVVIIDSASHAWEGEGGVLDLQQELGGKFQSWNDANKQAYNPLVSLLVGEMHGVHIISTVRAKQDYAMQKNEHTEKMEIAKLGLKPIQRDSLEYEMQIVLRIDMDHKFLASKDNSTLFKDQYGTIEQEHGANLYKWVEKGEDIFAERRAAEEAALQKRISRVEAMQAKVEEYGLQEWSEKMISHPAVGPLLTASEDMLNKYAQTLAFQIKEIDAKNKAELAEQHADAEQVSVEGK